MSSPASPLTFGSYLRQLRRRAAMTQADLAAAVGYSASFISNLETQARQPDVEAVAQLFIPALALQDEPKLGMRLIELAARARGIAPPASLSIVRDAHRIEDESADIGALPVPPTPLIGRNKDIDWICKRMLGHHGRLMTLLGPPGVGKTRLALGAAAVLNTLYTDGARFVPLDAVEDPALVPHTIAAVLDLEVTGNKPTRQILIRWLRRKEMLLVLDNFEHILSAAPLVAELLAACPGLRTIVTSRERLHLRAEQRYKVASLSVEDAADLFLHTAIAVNPDFVLSKTDASRLHELCLELDCLPLALELAATHIEYLDLPALLERLRAQRLDVLSGGPGDLPERQRALRTAIAYSYDRLTPGQRELFRTLGVFVGGFDLEAVQETGHSPWELEALITKNLVQRSREDEGSRFQMLDTLRAYALEQLGFTGELTDARLRHADFFLVLAEQAEPALYGPEQTLWFRHLVLEIHNLRAAIQAYLDEHDYVSATRICVALRQFWTMQSRLEEGRLWLDRVLKAGFADLPDVLRVKVLNSLGSIAFYQEDYEESFAFFQRALAMAEESGDEWQIAFALDGLGVIEASQGNLDQADSYSRRSLEISESCGYDWLHAITLINLGEIARQQGEDAGATSHYTQSLDLLRAVGDNSFSAIVLINLAQIALNLNDLPRAKGLSRESLRLSAAGGQHRIVAAALEKLAAISAAEHQAEPAGKLLGAATALRRRYTIPVQPTDRPDYESILASVRGVCTEVDFEELMTSGQTLPLDDILALAAEI